MAKRKPSKATSYSALAQYESCAKKHWFAKLSGLPRGPREDESPQIKRGHEVHKRFEDYYNGEAVAFKKGENRYAITSSAHKVAPEEKVGTTSVWQHCGYHSASAKWRGIIDVFWSFENVAFIRDVKTGSIDKKTGEVRLADVKKHHDQMSLYAAMLPVKYDLVSIAPWYIDSPEFYAPEITLHRTEINEIRDSFAMRLNVMQRDEIWAPNPTYLCGWCPFSRTKGGPCNVG